MRQSLCVSHSTTRSTYTQANSKTDAPSYACAFAQANSKTDASSYACAYTQANSKTHASSYTSTYASSYSSSTTTVHRQQQRPQCSLVRYVAGFCQGYRGITGWKACSGALLDPCSCDGVTCTDGDITQLQLFNSNLKGTIPSSLASLTQLTDLALGENALTGLVSLLPFKQYRDRCILDYPGSCTEPNYNHFKCPLPAGSEQCKDAVGAGVHCK
jgi:hypothetical protein